MLALKRKSSIADLYNLKNDSYILSYLYFFIMFILFIFVIKVGISKIYEQRNTLNEVKRRQSILSDKLDYLSKASNDLVGIFYNSAILALPNENPVLISFSQLKSLLNFYLLPIDEYVINVGSSSDENINDASNLINRANFQITVFGKIDQIESLLNDIESSSPIMSVNELTISRGGQDGDLLSVSMTINSFWSPFVEQKIKSADQIKKITEKEREILSKIGDLKKPDLGQSSTSGPVGKDNPFF